MLKLASCCPPKPKRALALNSGEACACVGDLGKDLGIAPSTVSHHIKELHRAGLIQMRRDGQTIRCSVEPAAMEELSEFFRGINGG
jgi:ArsR family transcriptional regulator